MTRVWAAGRFNDGSRFIVPFTDRTAARTWIAHNQVAARIFTVYSNTNSRPRDRLALDWPPAEMHNNVIV